MPVNAAGAGAGPAAAEDPNVKVDPTLGAGVGAGAGIDAALITVLLGAPWKAPGCPCGGAPRYMPQC